MMNDENPYEGYTQPAAPRRSYSADDLGYPKGAGLFKNPLISTLVLLAAAGLLAGVIMIALPGDDQEDITPVIQADQDPVGEMPSEAGGMEIPNRDSTVYSQLRSDGQTIENLLAPQNNTDEAPALDLTEKPMATTDKKPASAPTKAEKPTLHPAGSSPETLAFVRSVLDQSEANAEPAAGDESDQTAQPVESQPAVTAEAKPVTKAEIKPAPATMTHYIQLASIRDEAAAPGQWKNLQAKYAGVLSDSSYRVQRKDLGDKGIYYRIQAGPFAKADAGLKCEKIKAITPAGCFLVAK